MNVPSALIDQKTLPLIVVTLAVRNVVKTYSGVTYADSPFKRSLDFTDVKELLKECIIFLYKCVYVYLFCFFISRHYVNTCFNICH